MAELYDIISNYDDKEGWDEETIYGGLQHKSLSDRYAVDTQRKLIERAKFRRWGDEQIEYKIIKSEGV